MSKILSTTSLVGTIVIGALVMPLAALAATGSCAPRDRTAETRSVPAYRNVADGSVNTNGINNLIRNLL